MAPEILGQNPYNNKADLWSVGAVLFEMVAGRPPFAAQNQVNHLPHSHKH
jgi:serine/threonine-protein kinase ULK/ATG1